jgi:hypothetical protein
MMVVLVSLLLLKHAIPLAATKDNAVARGSYLVLAYVEFNVNCDTKVEVLV